MQDWVYGVAQLKALDANQEANKALKKGQDELVI